MPYGDGTGPMGQGSMTGRAAGFCAGNNVPGNATGGFGRGFGNGMGFGRGRGRGYRNRFFAWGAGRSFVPNYVAQPDPEVERGALIAQADALKRQLTALEARLAALEKTGKAGDN